MKKIFIVSAFVIAMNFLVSCAGTAPVREGDKGEEGAPLPVIKESDMAAEEQQAQAFALFNEILVLSQQDRRGNRDKVVEHYQKIITGYPDAPIAQEGYLRLIDMYLKEFKPPEKAKALYLYKLFKERYPESHLGDKVEKNIATSLYRNKDWEELVSFFKPHVNEFIKTGELKSSLHMYLYSEAKYNLKDYKEAYKGYKIVIQYFPQSIDAKISEKRMVEIEKQLKQEKDQE